ncbi:MAG: 1,4-alpha-glucan branching enzyme, partial [Acidobacteriota bacterium]
MTSPSSVTRLSEDDLYLFHEGSHLRLYEKMGAHLMEVDGQRGVYFAVFAPNAARVSVIGDFNSWNVAANPMQRRGWYGVFETFVPGLGVGTIYKYHIESRVRGYTVDKMDPHAFFQEVPPRTASVVFDLFYEWHDHEWMASRGARQALDQPMSLYEVHLGSWMRGEGNRFLSYTELAPKLAAYVKEMGFT